MTATPRIVQMRAVDPSNDKDIAILPGFANLTASSVKSQTGSIQFDYPASAINAGYVYAGAMVRILIDSNEPLGCRFILEDNNADDAKATQESGTVTTWTGRSFDSVLEQALVFPLGFATGLYFSSSTDPSPVYTAASAGAIMKDLIDQAHARGSITSLGYSFSATLDSFGNAWAQTVSTKYSPGQTLLDVLNDLVDMGLCEFDHDGQELLLLEPTHYGSDRANNGPNQMVLARGRDLVDSPNQGTIRGLGTVALVQGETHYVDYIDAAAEASYGRREIFVNNGTIDFEANLRYLGYVGVESTNTPKIEKSHDLSLTNVNTPLPFVDFQIGDLVLSDVDGSMDFHRVVQFTLSVDENGIQGAQVTFDTLIDEAQVKAQKQLDSIANGTSTPGGVVSGGAGLWNGVLNSAPINSDVYNDVTSLGWVIPDTATGRAGGITFKMVEDTWGTTLASPRYGDAQPWEVLSPSTTDASNTSDDGTGSGGTNPVLARQDRFGGYGNVQGIHISPGLRDTHGGGTPIGLWVQLVNVDTFGVIASGPDLTKVPAPFAPLFQAQTYLGKKIWNIAGDQSMNMFEDDGTTGVVGLYGRTTPLYGARAILRAGTAATRILAMRREASQTAVMQANLREDGTTLLSAVDGHGDFVTFADDGFTGVTGLYTGDTPVSGIRAIFDTHTPATVGVGIKIASGQSGAALATYGPSGSHIADIIDNTGHLVGGGGSGLTSFNGRTTAAATLTAGDITALGGGLYPLSSPPFGYMLYSNGSNGSFWSPAPAGGGVSDVNGYTGSVNLATVMASLGGQLVPTPPASGNHQLWSIAGFVTWI